MIRDSQVHTCVFIQLTSRQFPSLARIINLNFVTAFSQRSSAFYGHFQVTEWLRLAGTAGDTLVQSHCSEQGWLKEAAQVLVSLTLKGWRLHSLSDQHVLQPPSQ